MQAHQSGVAIGKLGKVVCCVKSRQPYWSIRSISCGERKKGRD